jgi:branched-chain amino acid transport system substrate-binding protein
MRHLGCNDTEAMSFRFERRYGDCLKTEERETVYKLKRSMRHKGYLLAAAVAAVALLALSASAGGHTTIRNASFKLARSSKASAITAKDVSVAHAYVGGTIGKADPAKTPIEVGLIVSNTGPVGQPYLVTADNDAISFINGHLGGIAGHPIKLILCNFGATPQQGQACGQEFASNPKIKAVLFAGGTEGVPQMISANAAKKVYFCTVAGADQITTKNMFCTTGGPLSIGAIATYLTKYVHAKNVSIVTLDDPTLAAVVANQKAQYAKLGISAGIGLIPAASTNVTASLVASGAQNAGAIVLELPAPTPCPAVAQAIKSLGVKAPVISLASCASPSVQTALGYLPKWTFFDWGPNVAIPDPSGKVQVYLDAEKAYGNATGQNSTGTFGTALLMAKVMNKLGPSHLTTTALAAKMKAYTGPLFLGDPNEKFGVQPFPSVGSTRARFYTYEGNGHWHDATNGKYLSAG